MSKLYVSIGALKAQGIRDRVSKGYDVIAYEPENQNYQNYQKLLVKKAYKDRLICYRKAVGSYAGKVLLRVSGTGDGGSSTILESLSDFRESYYVEIVTLDSILEPLLEVNTLDVDCEGAEIDIILGASLKNLQKCKRILVEFHKHYPQLQQTDEMIQNCIKRLEPLFEVNNCRTYHPNYIFYRK